MRRCNGNGNGNRNGCQASFLVSDMLAFRGSFSNVAGVKVPKTGATSLSIDVNSIQLSLFDNSVHDYPLLGQVCVGMLKFHHYLLEVHVG